MAKNGDLKSLIVFITVISSVMALLGVFEELLNYVAACAYPIYMSFKTLNNNDIEESRRWLVYWIVFGATRILKSLLIIYTK